MLAKPTRPFVPTIFDLEARRRYRSDDAYLFAGWGVSITGNRIQ